MAEHFKVAIVGSGPGGLSAAGHAAKKGISHILLERTDHASDTIYKYQKGKLVMATPDVLPLRSDMGFEMGIREGILESWDKSLAELKVNIRYGAEVTGIKGEKGKFEIQVNKKETITAEYVILAIGLQGNINKVTMPGAERPEVQYQLDDPDEYEAENIVVIGAGDAAIENAVALARSGKNNQVSIVNRRDEFARAKQGNLSLISDAIDKGQVTCYYNSAPVKLEPGTLTLKTADGEAKVRCDRIIARLGATPPRAFVEACGIQFPNKDPGCLPNVDGRYMSNVPGLYIIGALGGYPLIKQAMNQGYEVVEFIEGNLDLKPADEPLLEENFKNLGASVEKVLETITANVPILAPLSTLQLREVMVESTVHTPKPGEVIFRRNDFTNTFYCIVQGEVDIQINPTNEKEVVTLGTGAFFGEMGLIAGRRRSATIVAKTDCVLIEVPRRTMIKLMNSVPAVKRVMDETAIVRQIQTYLAPQVSTVDLAEVVANSSLQRFGAGQELFHQGDAGDSVHLIRNGSVTVSRTIGGKDVVLSYVPSGNYVGEMALLLDSPRTATIKAAVATESIKIDGAAFKKLLDRAPQLKQSITDKVRQRIQMNERMAAMPEVGNIIQYLVDIGGAEATDILLIDESLCVRCDNCEKACAETHGGISRLDREAGPTVQTIHVPTSCRHCEHPHCMKDCPADAIHRSPEGEVFIDDKCIGCGNCERNCPYKVIHMSYEAPPKPGLFSWMLFGAGTGPGESPEVAHSHHGRKTAVKCDMCKGIEGGASCVRACPTGAAIRVNPKEFLSIATLAG